MPTTAAALAIIAIALLPGLAGSAIYSRALGIDWRERESAGVLRLIGFSTAGLLLYLLAASLPVIPPAIHVLPATYASGALQAGELGRIAWPWFGHLLGSAVAGVAAAFGLRALAKITGTSARPAAWDDFITDRVRGRWIVVTLKSGDIVCGYVDTADRTVDPKERDIVLSEPARYDAGRRTYIATQYQHLFLPATIVEAVATVYDAARDSPPGRPRLTTPGSPLFTQPHADISPGTRLTAGRGAG